MSVMRKFKKVGRNMWTELGHMVIGMDSIYQNGSGFGRAIKYSFRATAPRGKCLLTWPSLEKRRLELALTWILLIGIVKESTNVHAW